MVFIPNEDITVYYDLIEKTYSLIDDMYFRSTKEGWEHFYVKDNSIIIEVSRYDMHFFFTFENDDLTMVINEDGFVFMPKKDFRYEHGEHTIEKCIQDYFDYNLDDPEVDDKGSHFQHHLVNRDCGISYEYYPMLRALQKKFHSTYDFTKNFKMEED